MKVRFLAIAALILFAASAPAHADTFYRETFNFCEEPSGRPSAFDVAGWNAIKTNDPIGKPTTLRIQPVGAASRLRSVNSNPEGPEDGNAFWGRDDVTKGLLIYTDEASFEIADVITATWRQRVDRQAKIFANYQPRLAFLIDGTWYISNQVAAQRIRGIYERKEINVHNTTYGTTPVVPDLGIVAPTSYDQQLPVSGKVTAFGLFMVRAYARVRIDDFALTNAKPFGTNLPTTVYPRCQYLDDPVQPEDPTDDPAPVVPDTGIPGIDIPEVDTTPSDDETKKSRFCSANDLSSWVAMSSNTKKKLLKAAKGNSLIRTHDKLVLTLTSMGLHYNEVADIAIGDLLKVKQKNKTYYYLTLYSTGANIRISKSLFNALNKYMKKAKINQSYGQPMFREFYGNVISKEPLCSAQMSQLVQGYAHRAKVLNKISFY